MSKKGHYTVCKPIIIWHACVKTTFHLIVVPNKDNCKTNFCLRRSEKLAWRQWSQKCASTFLRWGQNKVKCKWRESKKLIWRKSWRESPSNWEKKVFCFNTIGFVQIGLILKHLQKYCSGAGIEICIIWKDISNDPALKLYTRKQTAAFFQKTTERGNVPNCLLTVPSASRYMLAGLSLSPSAWLPLTLP